MILLFIYLPLAFIAGLLIWACCVVGARADAWSGIDDEGVSVCRDCGAPSETLICDMCLESRRWH